MATTYTHTTFAQAKDRLATLLGDPTKTFYVDDELGRYIKEALRWWGLTTQYFRETVTVHLVQGQAFYDLPNEAEDSGGSLVQDFTITDREVINDINYSLMETPITNWPGGWVGTEMFSLEEISDLLTKGRDDILRDSGILVYENSYPMNVGDQRLDLDQDVIKLVRMSVDEVDSDGPLPMWSMDQFQAQSTSPMASFPTTGRPKAFATSYTPWLAVDVFPRPEVNCDLLAYEVKTGEAFTPTVDSTLMGLPDDACWITKYRTMEDLLGGDGLARAPELSEYCKQRVEDGLKSLSLYQAAIWSTVDGRRMTISPLSQMEMSRPDWEQIEGSPKALHPLSWNLIAVRPVPDGAYDITIEMVRKAKVPAADGDFIQVGQEWMGAIYDYAQHVAMFKCQGEEFFKTLALYQSAIATALECVSQQAAANPQLALQMRTALADRIARPIKNMALATEVTSGPVR